MEEVTGWIRSVSAGTGQYKVDQVVAEFAYKYKGFSTQHEYHWKNIVDKTLAAGASGQDNDLEVLLAGWLLL